MCVRPQVCCHPAPQARRPICIQNFPSTRRRWSSCLFRTYTALFILYVARQQTFLCLPFSKPRGSATMNKATMSKKIDLVRATVSGLQTLLSSGELNSVDLVKQSPEQIERHNTRRLNLRAVISVAPEQLALARAAKLYAERAAGKLRSPLHGIPILVKVRTCCSPLFRAWMAHCPGSSQYCAGCFFRMWCKLIRSWECLRPWAVWRWQARGCIAMQLLSTR